jgi:hypothetical protein
MANQKMIEEDVDEDARISPSRGRYATAAYANRFMGVGEGVDAPVERDGSLDFTRILPYEGTLDEITHDRSKQSFIGLFGEHKMAKIVHAEAMES